MRILLIEDHAPIRDSIKKALEDTGYTVDEASCAADADHILAIQDYALILLDLTLPDRDGLSILEDLRGRKMTTPVLILTARGDLDERVEGLDLGADDYLTKPFELRELQARVRALVRRGHAQTQSLITHGALTFDSTKRRATLSGELLDLPNKEMRVLELFLLNEGAVLSKEHIADQLASFDSVISPNAVELYVSRLRKKLAPAGIHIKTVRGLGYILETAQ